MVAHSPRLRLGILGIVIISLFASLFARLYYLQVMVAPEFQQAAESNRIRVVQEQAPRGRILDRNGKVIVDNRVSIVVSVDRSAYGELDQKRRDHIRTRLAEELTRAGDPVTPKDLADRIDDQRFSPFTPVPVAQDMPEQLKIYLEEHAAEFPSVSVTRTAVRSYPYGPLAAHVLGYVGEINDVELKEVTGEKAKPYLQGDDIGKTGVERVYEHELRGVPGEKRIEVDSKNRPIRVVSERPPIAGDDLVLTIDADVQAFAEKALADGLDAAKRRHPDSGNVANRAPAGSVVVENPKTGRLLAMASFPTYDPAEFVNGISTSTWNRLNDPANHFPLNNWAIQGQYAPGSTFKLFTAYAALSTGLKSPGEIFYDTGRYEIPRCEGGTCIKKNAGGRAYGSVDMSRALTVSSDVYFYDIGARFWRQQDAYGEEAIQTAARDFGLGSKTGITLSSERSGRIPTPEQKRKQYDENPGVFLEREWFTGDNVNMAIGQGDVAVTPLQLANGYASFANGGTVFSPNVALEVRKAGTKKVLRTYAPRVSRKVALSPKVRDPILAGLTGVVASSGGTAYGAFLGFPTLTFPVAGKTGTAQVSGNRADTAVFTSFGPLPDPRFEVTVILEEAGFGGSSAAPIARRLFDVFAGVIPRPEVQLGGGVKGIDGSIVGTQQAGTTD